MNSRWTLVTVCDWASEKLAYKFNHIFLTLLHHNKGSDQAIRMKFLPLMNNLTKNILQLIEN